MVAVAHAVALCFKQGKRRRRRQMRIVWVQTMSERDERAFFSPEGKRGVLRLTLLLRTC